MDFVVPILLFIVFAALVIGLGIYAHITERKRRDALAATASRLGLSFAPDRDYELAGRFQWIDALDHGSNRYAQNAVAGTWRNHQVLLFDYHYQVTTSNGKTTQTTHYHHPVFSLALPQPCPEVRIVPENLGSKIAQALGWEDIDFESAEFSRAFVVRSKDRKFAYDICHPRMMEFLLAHRDLQIEIEGDALATWSTGRLQPDAIEAGLDLIAAIRDLMPNYLFSETQNHA
ncbi:MAG TPA: hypothetical protein PLU30_09920 [Verrucomicrobiae bacterium]|nr:hypothetical protein [Verrucomicrobiae bacterium]